MIDKNNSIEIEQHHFGRFNVVRIFLDRTSGRFWEDSHETEAESLLELRERVDYVHN